MTTVARVKDGQTTMVAGVSQDEQARQVCDVAKGVMEKATLPAIQLRVRLVVDARSGKNWDEAH